VNLACHTIHKREINNCKKNVDIMKYLNSASTAMFHPCTYIYSLPTWYVYEKRSSLATRPGDCPRFGVPEDSFSLAGDTSSLVGDLFGLKYHAL
jgi:hypothetical protein